MCPRNELATAVRRRSRPFSLIASPLCRWMRAAPTSPTVHANTPAATTAAARASSGGASAAACRVRSSRARPVPRWPRKKECQPSAAARCSARPRCPSARLCSHAERKFASSEADAPLHQSDSAGSPIAASIATAASVKWAACRSRVAPASPSAANSSAAYWRRLSRRTNSVTPPWVGLRTRLLSSSEPTTSSTSVSRSPHTCSAASSVHAPTKVESLRNSVRSCSASRS